MAELSLARRFAPKGFRSADHGQHAQAAGRMPLRTLAVGESTLNPTSPTPPAAFSGRILLIDDNVDLLEAMSFLLADLGFEVTTASDPMAALALAPAFKPHVAVMDLGLPVMDGYRLAVEMRRLFPAGTPRLVAMSGYGQASDRMRSAAAGFEHHLVKPVDVDDLVLALRSLKWTDADPASAEFRAG